MLASILQTGGYKTGLYTSPHLYDFRERIKIDGIMAPEAFVVDFVRQLKPVIEHHQAFFL
jgi:dihydrofolate synthase/folylpolyglutamate synthase